MYYTSEGVTYIKILVGRLLLYIRSKPQVCNNFRIIFEVWSAYGLVYKLYKAVSKSRPNFCVIGSRSSLVFITGNNDRQTYYVGNTGTFYLRLGFSLIHFSTRLWSTLKKTKSICWFTHQSNTYGIICSILNLFHSPQTLALLHDVYK